jgi:hypothetical protein
VEWQAVKDSADSHMRGLIDATRKSTNVFHK